ncbi:MAG: beta-ketoacyl synthase chain length factor [Proteobacteria bacterium]|nr:beta-ketoacyl synthase chain length factor [Pseudomonadota bacterium]MBU1640126.1 beta-ketoacyl synthase chain length factor [Pseudomonadota bacterium]
MTVAVVATTTLHLADLVIPEHLHRDLRRAEDFIKLAVLASHQLTSNAPALNGLRTGIYLGTSFGPMECNFSVLNDLVMAEPISPTLFSHSVFNAASGYIARICKIYGPSLTLTSYGWPFFVALQAAWQAIHAHNLDHALVLQVETYSALLNDARTAMLASPAPSWPAGATAWLLGKNGACHIDHIQVEEKPCSPEARLTRHETHQKIEEHHPMAAAEELTTLIASDNSPQNWRQDAAYGRVELRFSRGRDT